VWWWGVTLMRTGRLREYVNLNGRKRQEAGEKYVMLSFIILAFYQIFSV
jgi:hypothetical protein